RARLAFRPVHDDRGRLDRRDVAGDRRPLPPGREPGSAPAAQPRRRDLVDDPVRPQPCRGFQTLAPTALLVLREPEDRTGRQHARGQSHPAILAWFGSFSSNPVRDGVQPTTYPLLVCYVGMRLIR